jgi:hypothetical protein
MLYAFSGIYRQPGYYVGYDLWNTNAMLGGNRSDKSRVRKSLINYGGRNHMKIKFFLVLIACTFIDALQSIRPDSKWVMKGTNYSGLIWNDVNQSKPTEEEFNQAISACNSQVAIDSVNKSKALINIKDKKLTADQRLVELIKFLEF